MSTAAVTLRERITVAALAVAGAIVLLFLMAYMDHQHSETDALERTAQVSNDRAAEHAAMKGMR